MESPISGDPAMRCTRFDRSVKATGSVTYLETGADDAAAVLQRIGGRFRSARRSMRKTPLPSACLRLSAPVIGTVPLERVLLLRSARCKAKHDFASCCLKNGVAQSISLLMTGEILTPHTTKKEKSMSSKQKRNGSTAAQAASTQTVTSEVPVRNSVFDEKIRRRAYEIYLVRGEQQGRELDDWLQAEREFKPGGREQAG
jgi:Protein of unknown function (DUF2934)